jgi:hypothetical protein
VRDVYICALFIPSHGRPGLCMPDDIYLFLDLLLLPPSEASAALDAFPFLLLIT